jgi:cell wall-associated protease
MGNLIKLSVIAFLLHFFVIPNVISQDKKNLSKEERKNYNWQNLDPKKNKIAGIGTDKAYAELLKNKKATRVIVAVIDGGVDINQEDLKNKIWVNEKEIPGNGIDDDHNGYIDDIHGWNFLGNTSGKNINDENLELTRIYKILKVKYSNIDTLNLSGEALNNFTYYQKIRETFYNKYSEAKTEQEIFKPVSSIFSYYDSIVCSILKKNDYSLSDIKSMPTPNKFIKTVKKTLLKLYSKGYSKEDYEEYIKQLNDKINFNLNTDFNPRDTVGDNPAEFPGKPYGNNDVTGPEPFHGTFVSGIIAANRNNNIGINGIADSVKIMVLRAVPNGDEYDKDIANAIIYAVNNGAQIINCSFGKSYSPNKQFVDSALRYAMNKGVLIVHAAGNESENVDTTDNYPSKYDLQGNEIINSFINVGASCSKANKELVAGFSNYGKKTVDIFAPGYRIYSTKPENHYGLSDGTSFSSPMVAGTAALIKSYYPRLSAVQIKDILIKSGKNYSKLPVYMPGKNGLINKEILAEFGDLSVSGSVLNVYDALKLAEEYSAK